MSQKVKKECFGHLCRLGSVGCSWGLDVPAHLSPMILWPRVPSQNVQTENLKRIDFAHFWCKGTTWELFKNPEHFCSRAHILGFTGFEILEPPGTPKTLKNHIPGSQPFLVINEQSWRQSFIFNPKNLNQEQTIWGLLPLGVVLQGT